MTTVPAAQASASEISSRDRRPESEVRCVTPVFEGCSLWVCVSTVIMGEAHLPQYDLIFTNDISKGPISK